MSLRQLVSHDTALKKLWQHLPQARLVGGCVRDLLLNLPVHDFDLATPQTPDVVTQTLEAAGFKVYATGLRHGTVTSVIEGRAFEITTLRRDVATDGRHAVVAWTDDWREDAARRDFTINAMSCDRAGQVHDYFDGQADLAARHLRFVGDAETRIREDALRILRFFRFLARFDVAKPDQAALTAIRDLHALIERLSGERIAAEIMRIVVLDRAPFVLNLMQEVDVLPHIVSHPNLHFFSHLLSLGAPAEPRLRLAALRPAPDEVKRLRLSREDTDFINSLNAPRPLLDPVADDAALRRALSEVPPERLTLRSWMDQAADPSGTSIELWQKFRTRLSAMEAPLFPLQGRDLLDEGMSPGKALGTILKATEDWWRARGCVDGLSACLSYALTLRGFSRSSSPT
ncbi:Poly(A) polymerase/t-RNA nucleotidyltransferase [Acetobacteraceae bacterium EV16G]|uniref:Poly(A) polymerase/t-RNA nucleotidyltransferase n=1 Tax=Sorlinia euscelidii TaxID=3081148 RepID=A0ABU7TYB2_9PROT